MGNRFAVCLSLLTMAALSGCGDQRILEKVGFTQTTSYDLLPDGRLKIAVAIPKADPEAELSRQLLTTTALSSKEARINLSRQTNLILVSGQMRNTLYGLSLAKSGLWNHIDTLMRDPSISPQVKVTVVNGDAESLLKKNYEQHPRTGKYIDRLLEKEAQEQAVPKVTLYEFARNYFDDGVDPVAPIVKDDGDSVIVDGIALFRDDKYAGRIEPGDSIIFALLERDFKKGEISIELAGEEGKKEIVMFSSLISSRKVEVGHGDAGTRTVNINVDVKGSILEYIGRLKLSDDANRHELERKISEHLSSRGNQLVGMMQEKGTDSLGIGMYVRNSMSYAAWKKLNWREEFPDVQVKCNIHVKIKDYGKFR
ncbi:spore gernimation protein GerC [Gordoniibacillus kamchatkensis]|uniref:Spore gernimation protein GerC n=1 Tax=Gordoniibacillus kamchatkensis TaxID=1590651 RepID=A0ABR5AGX5_9BACL|nr:Ger(x)C family spore germination protein [Paenibacillus sp. VKM B-2647]KIL39820.1 spore gernimation protein GerC [Paenibacillus sp. VKM B-2647]